MGKLHHSPAAVLPSIARIMSVNQMDCSVNILHVVYWSVEASLRCTCNTATVQGPAVCRGMVGWPLQSFERAADFALFCHNSLQFSYIKGSFNLSKGFGLFCLQIFCFVTRTMLSLLLHVQFCVCILSRLYLSRL